VAVDFCITKIPESLANTTGCMAHLCHRKYYKCSNKLACHHKPAIIKQNSKLTSQMVMEGLNIIFKSQAKTPFTQMLLQ
jgi:hypothetical protein